MKTTVELPDATFRRAKSLAADRGITLKRFFTDAVERQLRRIATQVSREMSRETQAGNLPEPPWMAGFGELADLRDEHRRVLDTIEAEFERVSPRDLP